ncbi:MAG: MaoC family dehydratase [Trueperaceae bacterium]|nr:MaoC family dehydratase [Trueperaceae bacterium]
MEPSASPSTGRWYDDFEVGAVYRHWPGRTITETDNSWFTLLTMNTHPLHFDAAYAAETQFGRPLVNSCLTLSVVVGMSVRDVSQAAIANLGFEKVALPNPVFNGDTLYARSTVLSMRVSRSDPSRGIVRVRTVGVNQDEVEVLTLERSVLVPRR